MISITPCRSTVSDRFPIASFVVHVPPDRLFEVACATDPLLFHPDQRARRRPENFATSASRGLLRAPAGQATYLMPPAELSRFAGAKRLYYALGAYRGLQYEDPVFTIAPRDPQLTPSIHLAADFTGGSRVRVAQPVPEGRYGAHPEPCAWGGDAVAGGPRASEPAPYDDGFDPKLWAEPKPEAAGDDELAGFEDVTELRRGGAGDAAAGPRYGRGDPGAAADLAGFEDAADLPRGGRAPSPTSEARLGRASPAFAADLAGFEDAAQLREAGGGLAPRLGAASDEEQGFEDAPHLERASATLGDVTPPPRDERTPGSAAVPSGRSAEYSNDYRAEDLPEEGEQISSPVSISSDAAERLHLIDVVAALESGADRYSAVNADGEYNDPGSPQYGRVHVGLSWGFVQFAQRYGALGKVLQACRRRDERRGSHDFEAVFGSENVEELLRVTNAATDEERVAQVGGLPLWDPAWAERFRQAGRITTFQEAQRETADQLFLLPNLRLAGWLGLDTPRALAMVFDRCVHMGPGGGPSWIVKVVGPIKSGPQRDAALARLGAGSVAEFKKSVGLPEDSQWDPAVHAALVSRLRPLGHASPVPIATCREMEAMLVEAAEAAAAGGDRGWKDAARRLALLANSDELGDQVLEVP